MPELYIDPITKREYNVSDGMLDKFKHDHPNAILQDKVEEPDVEESDVEDGEQDWRSALQEKFAGRDLSSEELREYKNILFMGESYEKDSQEAKDKGEEFDEKTWEKKVNKEVKKEEVNRQNVKDERLYNNPANIKARQDALKEEYIKNRRGSSDPAALLEEYKEKLAKVEDFDVEIEKRLNSNYGAGLETSYKSKKDQELEEEKMTKKGYVKFSDGWILPEDLKRSKKDGGIYKDPAYTEIDVFKFQKIEPTFDPSSGHALVSGGAQVTSQLVSDVFDADPIKGPKLQEPLKKFFAVVGEDGNLIDWKEYYEEQPILAGDELVVGTEHEDILKSQPGSYIIDTPDKLRKYADSKNLPISDALDQLEQQTNSFNAHQEHVKLLNYDVDKDWYIQQGIDHEKYLKPPVIDAALSEIYDIDIRKREILEDERFNEEGKKAWDLITEAKAKEKEDILNAKGKENEEELIKKAQENFNKTRTKVGVELENKLDKEFSYYERQEAKHLADLKQSVDISEYAIHDQDDYTHSLKKDAVSQRDVAESFLNIEKALTNPDTTPEEYETLWNKYKEEWELMDKEGAKEMWDFNTGKFIEPETASKEVSDFNMKMDAAALKLSHNNSLGDIKKLRNRSYFNLKTALQEVVKEGKVGDWGTTGILDYLRPRLYQDLGDGKKMPKNLSIIPGDGTRAIIDFNEALRTWQVNNKAYMLNLNPETLEGENFGEHFLGGIGDFFGFNERMDSDMLARTYVQNTLSEGGRISDKGVERLATSWSEGWRGGGSIVGFAGSFALNPFSKIKLLQAPAAITKGIKLVKKSGSVAAKVKKGTFGTRAFRSAAGATGNGLREMGAGYGYDKLMGQMVNQHQEFGPAMWFSVGFGGYYAGRLMMGLSAMPATASTSGAGVWKSFTNGINNVTKKLTYPLVSTPIRKKLFELNIGAATSTSVMLGSELAVEALSSDHSLMDVWRDVMTPITHQDFYTGEDVRMDASYKVLHTYAMMGAGHLGHTKSYKDLYNAIELTGKHYKNKKSLPRDYETMNTSEEEASKFYNKGNESTWLLMLKAKKLAQMRKEGKEITKEEIDAIDKSIENIKESNNMKILKKMIIENNKYTVNENNVDRELYYFQQRLQQSLGKTEFELDFDDADMLAGLDPNHLNYLSDMISTSGKYNVPQSSLLNRKIQLASDNMKKIRDNVSDAVWNDPISRKEAYESVNELQKASLELRTLEIQKSNGEVISDSKIEAAKEKLEKLNNEVAIVLSGAEKQARDIEVGEKISKKAGIKPQLAKNKREFLKLAEESGYDPKNMEDVNAFYGKDGVIIVNKEGALQQELFANLTHETLHPIVDKQFEVPSRDKAADLLGLSSKIKEIKDKKLEPDETQKEIDELYEKEGVNKYVKDRVKQVNKLIKEFKKSLNAEERAYIDKRIEDYKYIPEADINSYSKDHLKTNEKGEVVIENGKVELKEHVFASEMLTALHEAVTLNKVNYNESTWKKLGKSLGSTLRGIFPKAEFRSGKEVYDFVRAYSGGVQRNRIPLEVRRRLKEYKKELNKFGEVSASRNRIKDIQKEKKQLAAELTLLLKSKTVDPKTKQKIQDNIKELTAEQGKIVEYEKAIQDKISSVKSQASNRKILGSAYGKAINDLVKIDGRQMTNKEWRDFLLEMDGTGKYAKLMLDHVNELLKTAIEGKIKGSRFISRDEITGDVVSTVPREIALEILNGKLVDMKFSWEKIIEFDPEKNDSFNAYVNLLIDYAYRSTNKEIKKRRTTKSLDDKYDGGRDVHDVEETGLDPSEQTHLNMERERLEGEKEREAIRLKETGASDREVSEAAGRSTAKNVVDLNKTEQQEIIDEVGDILMSEDFVKQMEGDNFAFLLGKGKTYKDAKGKNQKGTGEFKNKAIKELNAKILNKIPKAGGGKSPEYKKWLEEKFIPEIPKILETNPELIISTRKWDILYEPILDAKGEQKKYSQVEAKKVELEKNITNVAAQNKLWKILPDVPPEKILNYLTRQGEYSNLPSRPNEIRLSIGKLLTEKIVTDATNSLEKSTKLTSEQKDFLSVDKTKSEIAQALRVEPDVSFSRNRYENMLKENRFVSSKDIIKIHDIYSKLDAKALKEIEQFTIDQQEKDLIDLADEHGYPLDLMREQILSTEKHGKSIVETLKQKLPWLKKLRYAGHGEKLTKENIQLHKDHLKETVNALAELGIDLNNKEFKKFSSALHQTFGFGSLKFPNGERFNKGEFVKEGKGSNLDAWRKYTGDPNLGKVKKGKVISEDIKEAAKNFWMPNWGYGGKGKLGDGSGSKYLVERFAISESPKDFEKMSIEDRKKSEFLVETRNVYTAPHLRDNPKGLEMTLDANRKMLELVVKAMTNNYAKKPTLNNMQKLVFALHTQVNAANGVIKGGVPMTSVTVEPKGVLDKTNTEKFEKATHNEHMVELNEYTKDILNAAARFKKHKNKKLLNSEIEGIVKKLNQALISEETQVKKDKSGASVKDFENQALNTFQTKSARENQYRITGEYYGWSEAQILKDKLGINRIKKIIESIPENKRSVEAIEMLQRADNAKSFEEVFKSNNTNLPAFSASKNPKSIKEQIKLMETTDVALEKARKLDKEPKKARVFDFDDTLATTDSRVIYDKPNTTGKPSSKLKAIVLAGAPGSGKSSVVKGLGLEKQGYKTVNQDISLEWAKKLVGLPEVEAGYDAVQRSVRSEMGALAKKIAERKLDKYTNEGTGVVLDGTGASIKATRAKIEALKEKGYDVKMVYVETSKETALQRNRDRKQRSLKDKIVDQTWDSVNANKAEYAKEFGENFFEANTDNLKQGEMPPGFVESVNSKLNATERGRLEAGGFAEHGDRLTGEGAKFDFREFEKVIEGGEGPLLGLAKMINEAKGDRNMFVLTARPQEAAPSIHEFLKSMGLDIPIENITGLANGAPAAKAEWMVEKAAEGFNDFYFADDHGANVEAVQKALDQLPVKSKTQQAKPKFSLNTKRDLKWDKVSRKHAGNDIEVFDTEFDINGKKYGISMEQVAGDFYFKGDFVEGGRYFDLTFAKLEERSLSKAQVKAMKKAGMNESTIRRAGFTMDTDITGTGNAAEILSIVSNGIFDFVKKNNIDGLIYSSGHTSRTRIYDTLTKFWAEKLGWERSVESYKDGTGHTVGDFTIAKPLPTATIVKNLEGKIGKELGDAKFSMDTKKDLEWVDQEGNKPKKGDQTIETRFDFDNSEYKIRLDRIDGPVGTRKYSLYFSKIEQRKAIVAKREGEYSSPAKEVGRIDITGTGGKKSGQVLSIISNGVLDIVKKHNMTSISFSSGEGSRTRLYKSLTKYWAEKLGWKHEVDLDSDSYNAPELAGGNFMISKPVSKRVLPSWENASKPVRDVLNTVDIKGRNQEAMFSKNIDKEFNQILEEKSGIEWYKEFSPAKAEVVGKKKGRGKFFIPPSAEDFLGLVYPTLAKGKIGEGQMKWYKKILFNPYSRAIENLSTDRVNLMKDFKALKKQLEVPKDLKKKTKSGFTNEQAVRVYLWNKLGTEIPGLSKSDLNEMNLIIKENTKLQSFADQILEITKGDGYSEPGQYWLSGNITTDLIDLLNTTKRNKYLEEWKQNIDIVYSDKNLNKLEAMYGSKYREALENMLERMKTGKNRTVGGNRLSNSVLNYINQAQGSIMFLNMKSGLLQTISSTNYINWTFNNPAKAGAALANFPQYRKDWLRIMNSDYLVDRRNGLKLNISENEIADATKNSTNKAKALLNLILEKGYAPTKFADSFAIATGGATYFRNRVKDLMKRDSNLTLKEAEAKAFEEFRDISELSQQSSDPSKISSQQASDIGRVTLQFVNTPMQYARLQKRSFQDLMAGRGDKKTHISKILYYGFMQNLWFNAMQSMVFAIGWDDGVSESEEKRLFKTYNGMADSILRGIGMAGMTVSVLKNLGIDIYDRSQKSRPEYSDAWIKLLEFSPAIKSKLSKFRQAGWPFDSKKRRAEIFDKGFSLDNPAYRSVAKVVEGATSVPLDRLYQKIENLIAINDSETETWQDIAMFFGWPEWDVRKAGKGGDGSKKKTKKKMSAKQKALQIQMQALSN